jgi:tetratricopeptide (TPR) repeat protein
MRLNLKVKEARGAPLEVVVEFLRAWFGARLRGNALVHLERNNEALTALDRAVELDPMEALAHSNRGSLLLLLGRDADALISLDAAIELDPADAQSLESRGRLHSQLGDHHAAITDLNRAIELGQSTYAGLWRDITLARLGRIGEAIENRGRAAEASPTLGDIGSVTVHLLARDFAAAAAHVRQSLEASMYSTSIDMTSDIETLLSELAVDFVERGLVAGLVSAYSTAGAAQQLGSALVSTVSSVLPRFSTKQVVEWQRLWNEAGANIREFEVPLLLLSAGIAWWQDRDRAHLLALPQELRSVLEVELAMAVVKAPGQPEPQKRPKNPSRKRPSLASGRT